MPDYPGVTDTVLRGRNCKRLLMVGVSFFSLCIARRVKEDPSIADGMEAAIMKVGASKTGERVTTSGKLLRMALRRRRLKAKTKV